MTVGNDGDLVFPAWIFYEFAIKDSVVPLQGEGFLMPLVFVVFDGIGKAVVDLLFAGLFFAFAARAK